MRLLNVPSLKGIAAMDVNALSHRLKMRRVDARTNAAKVIDGESVWNRTLVQGVRNTMDQGRTPRSVSSPHWDVAVALVPDCSMPQPTGGCLLDLSLKAQLQIHRLRTLHIHIVPRKQIGKQLMAVLNG